MAVAAGRKKGGQRAAEEDPKRPLTRQEKEQKAWLQHYRRLAKKASRALPCMEDLHVMKEAALQWQ
jgi:hypothetical protein